MQNAHDQFCNTDKVVLHMKQGVKAKYKST